MGKLVVCFHYAVFYSIKKNWLGPRIIAFVFTALFLLNSNWNHEQNTVQQQPSHSQFQRIQNYAELQQVLTNNPKSVAMLDLYADWCVACKEFEKYTFSASNVQPLFEHILLLQVDLTKNSPDNTELMEVTDCFWDCRLSFSLINQERK